MFDQIKIYFEHNRTERNGAIALLIIIAIIILVGELYQRFYTPPILAPAYSGFADTLALESIKEDDQREPFPFNPNTLSDSGYRDLGFSDKEIATLRKYMASGATFKTKQDFAKLYFLDEDEYLRLEPYINIPPAADSGKRYEPSNKKVSWSDTASTDIYKYNPVICDLNFADTNELKSVPGIGSFYARKIVEYREELGGYHNLGQLLELWGMTPEKIDRFAEKVSVEKAAVKRIPINSATAQELARHPYISFYTASRIVERREAGGEFKNMAHLCDEGLLNADICLKLAPYLEF